MKRVTLVLFLFVLQTALLGCTPGPKSGKGLRLPDGDVQAGNAAFVELGCHDCHTIKGLELPATESVPQVTVGLGGEVSQVKTYGQLVTSIINPSHRFATGHPVEEVSVDGKSLMPDYNQHMTVQQLVDLVAFLQSYYKVVLPPYEYVPYT